LVVHAVAASIQDTTTVREGAVAFIKEAEVRATVVERDDQERVSRLEAESVIALVSTRGEAEGFTQKIALPDSELIDARQARDMAEANS
jgi:hypothetical protein